jgi:hypothetical protein
MVKLDGRELEYVPRALKTAGLCREAVTSDGRALLFVPRGLQTPEICLAAVKSRQTALNYVPPKIKRLGILPYTQRRRDWSFSE